jgi:hypothetical protein
VAGHVAEHLPAGVVDAERPRGAVEAGFFEVA